MKIGQRLVLGFSSLVITFGLFGIYLCINTELLDSSIDELDHLYETTTNYNIPTLNSSLRLLLSLQKLETLLQQYTAGNTKVEPSIRSTIQQFENDKKALRTSLQTIEHDTHSDVSSHSEPVHSEPAENGETQLTHTTLEVLELLDQKRSYDIGSQTAQLINLVNQGETAQAQRYLNTALIPSLNQLTKQVSKIETESRKTLEDLELIDNYIHIIRDVSDKSRIAIFIAIGGSIFLAIGISYYTIRSISKPITKLTKAAKKLGEGKLDAIVTVNSRDELGTLANTFNQMTGQLKDLYASLQEKVIELERSEANLQAAKAAIESENLRLSAELDVTRRLQQMILPKEQELSRITGLEISGFMESATEVGGDYYDVMDYNDRVKIGIGDVTGHGLESSVLMLMVQTAVRTLLEVNETDPVKFLNVLNRIIYTNAQRMNSDKNLSLCLLDYQAGTLKLSGQHEEMIVVRRDGQIERIKTVHLGFPIGLEPDITEFIHQTQIQLNSGDVVVLYTDGVTEAEDLQGNQFGLARLCDIVSHHCQHSSLEIQQAVIRSVKQHIGQQQVYDDITLLVFKQK